MTKTTAKPQNIKDEVNRLVADVGALKDSMKEFDTMSAEFHRRSQELEAMEPDVDRDIDTIESEGQEALVKDVLEEAESLDALEKADY